MFSEMERTEVPEETKIKQEMSSLAARVKGKKQTGIFFVKAGKKAFWEIVNAPMDMTFAEIVIYVSRDLNVGKDGAIKVVKNALAIIENQKEEIWDK